MIEFVGIMAAVLTTASFLPQALMALRTGNTEGISIIMYSMFTIGKASWLAYGIMIASLPLILANVLTLALAILILSLKTRAMIDDSKQNSLQAASA